MLFRIKLYMKGDLFMKNVYELFSLIGENMQNIRKNELNKSQEKMAEETNISRGFLSKIESKKMDVGVSLDTLFIIAQTYDIDIRKFFEGYNKFLKKNKDEK